MFLASAPSLPWGVGSDQGAGGPAGTSILRVQNGGTVNVSSEAYGQNSRVFIGYGTASNGVVEITGAGSTFAVSSDVPDADEANTYAASLNVGQNGTGTLTVNNGGQLLLDGTDDRSPNLDVGFYASGTGFVTVNGMGSLIQINGTNTDGFGLGGSMDVGREGTGTLTIQGGGVVELTGAYSLVTAAREAGSTGTILIDGAGSLLQVGGRAAGRVGLRFSDRHAATGCRWARQALDLEQWRGDVERHCHRRQRAGRRAGQCHRQYRAVRRQAQSTGRAR